MLNTVQKENVLNEEWGGNEKKVFMFLPFVVQCD
jgi:hypothetical protein